MVLDDMENVDIFSCFFVFICFVMDWWGEKRILVRENWILSGEKKSVWKFYMDLSFLLSKNCILVYWKSLGRRLLRFY